MKTPKGWRKGQTIYNFLEWLTWNKSAPVANPSNTSMADPFHLSDEEWNKLYQEFLEIHSKHDPSLSR